MDQWCALCLEKEEKKEEEKEERKHLLSLFIPSTKNEITQVLATTHKQNLPEEREARKQIRA